MKWIARVVVSFLFMGYLHLSADEYLYPVGSLEYDGEKRVLILYQKSISDLELLIWNPVTLETTRGLLSTFTPAGLQMLPDQSGFSFVDNGRIRIKSFNKRSPKAIDFFYPIDGISMISWIDNNLFYFTGQMGRNYGIFQGSAQGDFSPIINDSQNDYLYPQKIGDQLFFIRRDQERNSIFCSLDYPTIEYEEWLTETDEESFKNHVESMLLDSARESLLHIPEETNELFELGKRDCAFLNMTSEKEGFYVEHPGVINKHDTLVNFAYHHLYYDNETWNDNVLFAFSLPSNFFKMESDMRVYESLLPFLPRVMNDTIYYMHCDDPDHLKTNLFSYNFSDCLSCKRSPDINSELFGTTFFSPLYLEPMIFYGGRMSRDYNDINGSLPSLWINNDGMLCASLPSIIDPSEKGFF